MKRSLKWSLVLVALGIVCLGWTTTARAAYLTTDGDFNNQTDNALLVLPWNVSAVFGLASAQSPFTNVFAANSMGAGWTNNAGDPWMFQTFSAISSNATGLCYMNADFMIPYGGVGGYRFAIGDISYGSNGLLKVFVGSAGLFAYSASGQGASLLTPAVGVWYNLQLTLDMGANTYSGAVVRADNSEQTLISSRSFSQEKTIDRIFVDLDTPRTGNPGGRVDNFVFATNAFSAPPSYPGNMHYVAQAGQTPSSNYLNWATAASNIQDALAVSAAGHTVLVSNGTYNLTNQITIAANITVKSVNGTNVTFVNGNNYEGKPVTNRCFTCSGVLDGFTISNGFVKGTGSIGGGGVYLNVGATMRNCVITGNKAVSSDHGGGGVYLRAGGTVSNCTIAENTASNCSGGGAFIFTSTGLATGTMCSCTIMSNTTTASGGGVAVESGGVISNCTISGNRTTGAYVGSGVTLSWGGTLANCIVKDNVSTNWGAGVYLNNGGGTVVNCLMTGNSWSDYTFGVAFFGGGTMNNCTISGNTIAGGGGVVVNSAGVTVNNCIVWGNIGVFGNWWTISGAPTVSYTDSDPVQTGTGNIAANPLFAGTNSGNYRLAANSPCVNTGTNGSWTMGATDLDGRPRIDRLSGRVDMGAYEYICKISLISIR